MLKKIFNLNSLIIFLALAIVLVLVLWGYLTKWKYWVVSSQCPACPLPGPCPGPGPGPGPCPKPSLGIALPPSYTDKTQQLAVQNYVFANYPKISQKLYSPDFWKTLDFVWNMTCYSQKNDRSYIPAADQSDQGNVVFRYLVAQIQKAILPDQKFNWLTFTPLLENVVTTSSTGFTYRPTGSFVTMGNVPLALFDLSLLPLCSWHTNSTIGTKVNAVMVNRYPQGHLRTQALAYAAPGTGNTIVTPNVIPGVDAIILNGGFKSYASVEVMHCDTHLTEMTSSLDCQNSCDLLGNTCASHGPPGVGFGKWVYYTRGSGLWVNLGKTVVFRNKIDAIMSCINMWDGKDIRDNGAYVDENYTGTLKGKFDSSKLESWQRFVADTGGVVKKALQTLLTGSCLSPKTPPLHPGKPSTAVISLLDEGQIQGNPKGLDPLGIGQDQYTTGPCSSKPGYPDPNADQNTIALWWFWIADNTPGDWGLLAPLAPVNFTKDSEKCAWVLWACVNGYDFEKNPENYVWSDVVTSRWFSSNNDRKKSSMILNSFLNNMSNSGYTTDDILINLANYMKLDSVQLSTSQILGNVVGFEIFIFSGTVKAGSDPKTWVCDRVDNQAGMECIGSMGEKSNWLGGTTSLFFSKDPLSGPDDNARAFDVTKNTCNPTGYYLDGEVTAYSDSGGVGAPLSDLISQCQ